MLKERKCAYCSSVITEESYYEVDGKFYCSNCMSICAYCNTPHLNDSMTWSNLSDESHGYVCEECIEDEDRFFYCHHCEEYYPISDRWGFYNGDPICDNCSEHYEVCMCCQITIRRNDVYYLDRTEEYLCYDCYENKKNSVQDLLHEYSYKPLPVFYKCDNESDNTYAYLGVELECDVNDNYDEEKIYNAVEKVLDEYDSKLYGKRDSSLSDFGAEFVSFPSTLSYHMNDFGWKDILTILLDGTLKGHDCQTAGIHVHLDRRYFGNTQEIQDLNIAKLMLIMSKFYSSHIVKFSRRKEEALRWCTDVGLTMDSTDNEHTVIDKMKKCKDRGRYQCINLCNLKTVEFRIFRSTLNINTFFACLQFCVVISNFAKRINLEDIPSCEWKDIFLCSNYSELNKYLNERGLI